jgi:hypothetical protein
VAKKRRMAVWDGVCATVRDGSWCTPGIMRSPLAAQRTERLSREPSAVVLALKSHIGWTNLTSGGAAHGVHAPRAKLRSMQASYACAHMAASGRRRASLRLLGLYRDGGVVGEAASVAAGVAADKAF